MNSALFSAKFDFFKVPMVGGSDDKVKEKVKCPLCP